jgi:hypothetical protein
MIRVVLSSVPTVIGSVIVLSALKSGKKNDRGFVTTFLCEFMLQGLLIKIKKRKKERVYAPMCWPILIQPALSINMSLVLIHCSQVEGFNLQ